MISAPVQLPTRDTMMNDKQTPVASRYGDMVGPVGIDLRLAHHISISNASESRVVQKNDTAWPPRKLGLLSGDHTYVYVPSVGVASVVVQ